MICKICDKLLDMPVSRLAWWLLVVASLMSVADLTFSLLNFTLLLRVSFIVFAVFKASALYLLLKLCHNRVLRAVYIAVLVVFGVLAIVNFVGFAIYGTGISRRMIAIFGETTANEVGEFFPQLAGNLAMMLHTPSMLWIAAIGAILAIVAKLLKQKAFNAMLIVTIIAGILVSACFASKIQVWGKVNLSLYARIITHVRGYSLEVKALEELLSQRKPFPNADKVSSQRLAGNVVLVIGESALRRHHALYGYSLPTTPRLSALSDSLVVFSDAIGSSAATNDNISRILTFRRDVDSLAWYNYPSMIELFKCAGYRTYWLSNQECGGLWSNCSAGIALTADVVAYVGAASSEDNLSVRHDEMLLEPLRRSLADTASHRLVMCHLFGSHVQYRYRYPSSHDYFNADSILRRVPRSFLTRDMAQTIAEYDNSIRYTDSVVCCMIDEVRLCREPSVLIYFSDHGEVVYDDSDFCGRCRECAEVPMVVYANGAFRRRFPHFVDAFMKARNQPVTTANIVYVLMTVTGTHYPLYDATLDFLSPEFTPAIRYVDETPWEKDIVKSVKHSEK